MGQQVVPLTDNAQMVSSSMSIDTYIPNFIALIALMLLRALLAYSRERASFEAGKRVYVVIFARQ